MLHEHALLHILHGNFGWRGPGFNSTSGFRVRRMRDLYRQNGVTRLENVLGDCLEKADESLKDEFRKMRKSEFTSVSKFEVGGVESGGPLNLSVNLIEVLRRRARKNNWDRRFMLFELSYFSDRIRSFTYSLSCRSQSQKKVYSLLSITISKRMFTHCCLGSTLVLKLI